MLPEPCVDIQHKYDKVISCVFDQNQVSLMSSSAADAFSLQ